MKTPNITEFSFPVSRHEPTRAEHAVWRRAVKVMTNEARAMATNSTVFVRGNENARVFALITKGKKLAVFELHDSHVTWVY